MINVQSSVKHALEVIYRLFKVLRIICLLIIHAMSLLQM